MVAGWELWRSFLAAVLGADAVVAVGVLVGDDDDAELPEDALAAGLGRQIAGVDILDGPSGGAISAAVMLCCSRPRTPVSLPGLESLRFDARRSKSNAAAQPGGAKNNAGWRETILISRWWVTG